LVLTIGLAACGDDDGGGDTNLDAANTSTTSTTASSTTVTTAKAITTTLPVAAPGSTLPAAECNPKTDPQKPALPVVAFYKAWRLGDKACAEKLGNAQSVDFMFKLEPNGPDWDFQGCQPGEQGGGDCAFTYDGGSTHMAIVYGNVDGWRIVKVYQVAD
jgi:hypothetical protein